MTCQFASSLFRMVGGNNASTHSLLLTLELQILGLATPQLLERHKYAHIRVVVTHPSFTHLAHYFEIAHISFSTRKGAEEEEMIA